MIFRDVRLDEVGSKPSCILKMYGFRIVDAWTHGLYFEWFIIIQRIDESLTILQGLRHLPVPSGASSRHMQLVYWECRSPVALSIRTIFLQSCHPLTPVSNNTNLLRTYLSDGYIVMPRRLLNCTARLNSKLSFKLEEQTGQAVNSSREFIRIKIIQCIEKG